ncbi:phosphatidate cytidylyltransferase [Haploplasma modicum]|uniref:phosphatidate cytidylyltransferase n=1 Tax=Haploplasma modicum TaxID=2150 RepID=UPI00047CFF04|nr:phosphatidate cytidylyltransferase [Haploplasma modicum]
MKKRTITGAIMLIVLIPLLIIEQLSIPLKIVFGLGVVIGVFELLKMYNKNYKKESVAIIMLLSLASYVGIILNNHIPNLFIIITLINIIIILALSIYKEDFSKDNLGIMLFIMFYISLGAGSLISLKEIGTRFIVFLFLITMLTDVFAYLVGIKFGKHKMAPLVSPKKSWEGAIGGTIIAVTIASVFGILYGKILPTEFLNPNGLNTIIDGLGNLSDINKVGKSFIIIFIAIIVSIGGQIGDLVASKLKRNYEIKDFGNIFPGHGGVLDRFDSSFFASMILFTILMFINLI